MPEFFSDPSILSALVTLAIAAVTFVAGHKHWVLAAPTAKNPILDIVLANVDAKLRTAIEGAADQLLTGVRTALTQPPAKGP